MLLEPETAAPRSTAAGATEFVLRIIDQADRVARLYLACDELSLSETREQKEVIESVVAANYDGRTLIELLQNGHDAHPPDRYDGRIEIVLDEAEGEHGVLYVANGGNEVRHADFESMCRIARSTKRPSEGIGNKGVGFKSVLQLSATPEVYSRAAAASRRFDGYCFRFAREEDFEDLATRVDPARQGFAEELRENVASLKVPVPQTVAPARILAFAADGYATVVRLALRSPHALQRARDQVKDLVSSDVPLHLFLDRVGSIVILHEGATKERHELTRTTTRRSTQPVPVDEVVLQDGSAFIVVRGIVPESVMKDAIVASRREGSLGSSWDGWRGDGEVSIAFPTGSPLRTGRLFNFLPMGDAAAAPLAAFLQAPFFASLDRRSLEPTVPLNNILLSAAAELCVDVVIASLQGGLPLPNALLIDLLGWTRPSLPRLESALRHRELELKSLEFLPRQDDAGARVSLTESWIWRSSGSVFNATAVAATGAAAFVDTELDDIRLDRVRLLADHLELRIVPNPDELGDFAERCAEALAEGEFDAEMWVSFYDDLAREIGDGAALAGKRILVNDRSRLDPAGDAGGGGRTPFIAPRSRHQDLPTPPPEVVRRGLSLMHPLLPWRGEGGVRSGRTWLEKHKLVREYRTETILELVAETMNSSEAGATDDDLRECLLFAFSLWRSASRELSPDAMRRIALRVPTGAGWTAPSGASFGLGWSGPKEDVDRLFMRFLAGARKHSAALSNLAEGVVLAATELVERADDVDEMRTFLEVLGVSHGLQPRWFPAKSFRLRGQLVGNPALAPDFPISVSAEEQSRWRKVAVRWPRQKPSWEGVDYTATTGVAVLPGQREWDAFEHETKREYAELIIRGLDEWPDTAIEFCFARRTDYSKPAWPSLVAAFLATAAWIPQTTPGNRTSISLMPTAGAWWMKSADTPDYLRAQPGVFRALATPKALNRLQRCGVRFWDAPASASDRLEELAALVDGFDHELRGHLTASVRKASETAWSDVINLNLSPPERLVVARQGALTAVTTTAPPETVYLPDEEGVAQERLLAQAPVLMLPIRDFKVAAGARRRLEAAGCSRVRATSEAEISITADGQRASEAAAFPLQEIGGSWLPLLVLGVLDFVYRSFPPVTATRLAAAAAALAEAEVVAAGHICTEIDGHEIRDTRPTRSFVVEADDATRIVVAADAGAGTFELLQRANAALAELVEVGGVADSIRLALIDLERRCGASTPSAVDVATVLGVSVSELEGVIAQAYDRHGDVSAVVAVLACIHPLIAEELQGVGAALGEEAALASWLRERLPASGPTPEAVVRLADRGDLRSTIIELGVSLRDANNGLRAVGVPPLHNPEGHERQMAAYVQQHGARIRDELRDRFAAAADNTDAVAEYVRLLDLSGVTAAPDWLDQYWDVPETELGRRVARWIDEVAPSAMEWRPLPPVDDLRERGRRTITGAISNARVVVEAWLHRNAAGAGKRPAPAVAVSEVMISRGLLDFGRLTSKDVLEWLSLNAQWPDGMELTTTPSKLGLSDQDVADARHRLENARELERRKRTYVEFGNRTYSDDPSDLRTLFETIRASVPPRVLDTPTEIAVLEPAQDSARSRRGVDREPRKFRGSSTPSEKAKAIGLAGEAIVGEWLHKHFGVPMEDSWQSGYRLDLLADGRGDDSLGYDFRLELPHGTWLVEVKATVGDTPEFSLTEAEVRRAKELATDETYLIAFVTFVLDTDRCRVHLLPNPLASGGLDSYRIVGNALKLQFSLS